MKEYAISLWTRFPNAEVGEQFLDETSVDADSPSEALEVAAELFKEFHPELVS